jgi:hypothetical protein
MKSERCHRNYLGGILTVSNCTLADNQAIGGAGGSGGNGGSGFGGGIFNDALSISPDNFGTPSTLTVTGTIVTDNSAAGGAPGSGGSAGQGIGGGLYLAADGMACLDSFTQGLVQNNHASTSDNDIFGDFTTCL